MYDSLRDIDHHKVVASILRVPEDRRTRIQKAMLGMLQGTWRCAINAMALKSEFELETRGTPLIPVRQGGRHEHIPVGDYKTLASFCVAGIVELANQGAYIRICSRHDAVQVYKILDEYVRAWITTGRNSVDGPEDIYQVDLIRDLMAIENYAKTLFGQIKPVMTVDITQEFMTIPMFLRSRGMSQAAEPVRGENMEGLLAAAVRLQGNQ